MEKRCITCNTEISVSKGATIFKCPNCGEEIVRCGTCRETGKKWVCKCGFEGP